MTFKKINEDIKSGAVDRPAPVLLCGEESYLVDYYEKALCSLFSGGQESGGTVSDLDVSVFYGEEATDEAVIGALETFPMLCRNRIIVVKGHPDLAKKKESAADGEKVSAKIKSELADYMDMIPESARLIFSAEEADKRKALYKAIDKSGTVYELNRLDEKDLQTFIQKRLKEMKVSASAEVMNAFVLASGYLEKDSDTDLFAVKNELYKAACLALSENRDSVSISDIKESMPDYQRTYFFDMLDAISSGRKAEAITILENILAEDANIFYLLPQIINQFEIMLGFKELSTDGRSVSEMAKILGERYEWKISKLGRYARQFETDKLKEILLKLYAMEQSIKSGDIGEHLALTVLFAEI